MHQGGEGFISLGPDVSQEKVQIGVPLVEIIHHIQEATVLGFKDEVEHERILVCGHLRLEVLSFEKLSYLLSGKSVLLL